MSASASLKRAARELLKRDWTTHRLFKDARGNDLGDSVLAGAVVDRYSSELPRSTLALLRRKTKSCCLLGALRLANGPGEGAGRELLGEVAKQVLTSDSEVSDFAVSNVWWFNDNHCRGKGEAVQALDAAYVLALQEEGRDPEDVLG